MSPTKYILIFAIQFLFNSVFAKSIPDTLIIREHLKKADSLCSIHPDSAFIYSQKAIDAIPFIDDQYFVSQIYKKHAKVFYFNSFYDSSAYYLKEAMKYVPADEEKFRARLYQNYSAILMMQNKFDSSLYYNKMSFDINKEHNVKSGLINNYASFGSLFRRLGAYEISMSYIYKGLPIAEELRDTASIIKFLQTIAMIYGEMNNHELSNKYGKQALDLALATNNYKRASELANSVAEAYMGLKQYDESLKYYWISYNYARKVNFHAMEAVSLLNVADYYDFKDQPDSAIFYLTKVYDITKQFNYLNINTAADILYGGICIKTKQYDKASKYLLNAIEGKYKGESILINSAYLQLSELYEVTGDYAKAHEYYKIYSQRKDSTMNKQKTEEIANLRMQFELNKQQEEMEAETREKEAIFQAEKDRYKLIRNITIAGFFAILIIAALVIISYRSMQRQKLVNLKNEINSYRQRLMSQQINPHFIFNTLNSIQYFIYNNKKEESMDFVSQFAQLMRLNLYNSQNDIIALQDEIEALKLYLELERIRLDNKFDYTIDIDPTIDIKTQLVPSFLIQPIVENSIKHGILKSQHKGNIQTRIIRDNGSIIYSVIDNGIGFEKSKANQKDTKHTSYGLELTKKRISLIGILNSKQTGFTFEDIKEKNGECIGSKVELVIPSLLQLI